MAASLEPLTMNIGEFLNDSACTTESKSPGYTIGKAITCLNSEPNPKNNYRCTFFGDLESGERAVGGQAIQRTHQGRHEDL